MNTYGRCISTVVEDAYNCACFKGPQKLCDSYACHAADKLITRIIPVATVDRTGRWARHIEQSVTLH